MNLPGDVIRISGAFRDRTTGVLTDPTSVSLKIKDPEGTVTEYTYAAAQIARAAAGTYHYDLSIPDAAASEGLWYFKWTLTGTLVGAMEGKFKVADSAFTT